MDGWRGAGIQGQAGEDTRHQVHQGLENSLSLPNSAMSVHVFSAGQKNEPQKNLNIELLYVLFVGLAGSVLCRL